MSRRNSKHGNVLFLILGNQLFPPALLKEYASSVFFMAEDVGLCTYVKHHKQKIVLFLAAMRAYRDDLVNRGFDVQYRELTPHFDGSTYEEKLSECIATSDCTKLICFEIEDHFFESRIRDFAVQEKLDLTILPSPMFLTSREQFSEYVRNAKRPFMASFYQQQRKRLGILIDEKGKPVGGRWSFDDENRKKLPHDLGVPARHSMARTRHVEDVSGLVSEVFSDHPGTSDHFWLPTTRRQVLSQFNHFLKNHFHNFGDYEDALSDRDLFLFHSALSPALNLGLVTPDEIVRKAIDHAEGNGIPINSLEGFIRQVIGWREFIRGIYHEFDEQQSTSNYWNHERGLTSHWYDGTTGIPPLDDVIEKTIRYGWAHHIERLMIVGNLMLLCEIKPRVAYQWFMEMFVDSSDWVMGPNVFGMALFSDGGIFATKPYICGSNYMLKMSHYSKGPWCDIVDGLYWRFIEKHRDYFAENARLSVMTRALDRLDEDRRTRIDRAAEAFLSMVTTGVN